MSADREAAIRAKLRSVNVETLPADDLEYASDLDWLLADLAAVREKLSIAYDVGEATRVELAAAREELVEERGLRDRIQHQYEQELAVAREQANANEGWQTLYELALGREQTLREALEAIAEPEGDQWEFDYSGTARAALDAIGGQA